MALQFVLIGGGDEGMVGHLFLIQKVWELFILEQVYSHIRNVFALGGKVIVVVNIGGQLVFLECIVVHVFFLAQACVISRSSSFGTTLRLQLLDTIVVGQMLCLAFCDDLKRVLTDIQKCPYRSA